MANGKDSEDYVELSTVRTGLKRELALLLESQSQSPSSIGRTRSGRSQNVSLGNGVLPRSSAKRLKRCVSKAASKEEPEKISIAEDDLVTVKENLIGNQLVESGEVRDVHGDNCNSAIRGSEDDAMDLIKDDERQSTLVEMDTRVKTEDARNKLELNPAEAANEEKLVKDDSGDAMCVEANSVKPMEETPCNGVRSAKPVFTRYPLRSRTGQTPLPMTIDVKSEEVAESDGISSVDSLATKLEMKMSKKIALKRFPKKLTELLEIGLLEGLPVRYRCNPKETGSPETGLQGIIKGSGILCSCGVCGGTKVVTPNEFELHAGSSNKRPLEYICLENGNSLRDVLNACKNTPLDTLKITTQNAIGASSRKLPFLCVNCKGFIPEAGIGKTILLCDSCLSLKEHQPSPSQFRDTRSKMSAAIRKSSSAGESYYNSSGRKKGRLTRKDLRMHKFVLEGDLLPDGTELGYYSRGQKLLSGYKRGSGIFCSCCNSEVSPSQFEAHAGWASRRKPYMHIYTSNGVSLHELSISLSKDRKFSADENDDLCSICADGGDLLLCDNCPRAFHSECVSLPSIPGGTWYCKYCQNMFQKDKFVERNPNAVAAGRVAGIDPIEQITKRCIRIAMTPEVEVGGCVLCRGHDFCKSGFGPRTVILCDQCEKEYHVGCLKENNMDDLKELPQGQWFCSINCTTIHSTLQNLVAKGAEELPCSLLKDIKKNHVDTNAESSGQLDISWRLLSGKIASDESRVLLSKAVAIFHERFDPIADGNTSRLDLIPHMVYGRNVRDQEFGGMYCAILSVNSTVVSAGVLRVFGQEVAELPLVATSNEYQGQGYFQLLYSCIENLLRSLNVKNFLLPAADEAQSLWTNKFGFIKVTEEELKAYRRHHQMMIFQGTSMLHKSLVDSQISGQDVNLDV